MNEQMEQLPPPLPPTENFNKTRIKLLYYKFLEVSFKKKLWATKTGKCKTFSGEKEKKSSQ